MNANAFLFTVVLPEYVVEQCLFPSNFLVRDYCFFRYNCEDVRCFDGVFIPDTCHGVHCAVLLASTSGTYRTKHNSSDTPFGRRTSGSE